MAAKKKTRQQCIAFIQSSLSWKEAVFWNIFSLKQSLIQKYFHMKSEKCVISTSLMMISEIKAGEDKYCHWSRVESL